MFTLTDEATGVFLAVYRPEDAPSGRAEMALKMAAWKAKRLARREELTILLTGPGIRRRYAPVYSRRNAQRPYRVPCTCGGWRWPESETCRECYEPSPAQKERMAELGRSYRGRVNADR